MHFAMYEGAFALCEDCEMAASDVTKHCRLFSRTGSNVALHAIATVPFRISVVERGFSSV